MLKITLKIIYIYNQYFSNYGNKVYDFSVYMTNK